MTDKASTHRILEVRPEGFVVISGASGNAYLVMPLGTGGALCTCEHGRKVFPEASLCSHVRAVETHAAEVLARIHG